MISWTFTCWMKFGIWLCLYSSLTKMSTLPHPRVLISFPFLGCNLEHITFIFVLTILSCCSTRMLAFGLSDAIGLILITFSYYCCWILAYELQGLTWIDSGLYIENWEEQKKLLRFCLPLSRFSGISCCSSTRPAGIIPLQWQRREQNLEKDFLALFHFPNFFEICIFPILPSSNFTH